MRTRNGSLSHKCLGVIAKDLMASISVVHLAPIMVNQEEFERLKSKLNQTKDKLRHNKELAEIKTQVHAIIDYIKAIGGYIPPHVSTQPPTNQQVLFLKFK